MILAVNIGNTNTRAAIGQNEIVSSAAILSDALVDDRSFIRFIERQFGYHTWNEIEGSIVSSVVPSQTPIVEQAITEKTGKAPQKIDILNCGGLKVSRYGGALGQDRAVCCAAALKKYAPPLILIDFGTATTVNVINRDGEFLGGAILSGAQIGLKALSEHTALLPRVKDMDDDIPVIGKSTKENLESGAIIGSACAAEGYVKRIERELNCSATVIVTGGHAPMILPYCEFENIHEPNLLLEGLILLFFWKKEK